MKLDRTLPVVGSNAERTRLHNRQVVLQLVRNFQPVGRAEIARLSGLSTQTVSNIIAELEADAFLLETGRHSKGRGLPTVQYSLKPNGAFALGIEIRPDAMFTALVDLVGDTLYAERIAMSFNEPEKVCSLARDMLDRALKSAGLSRSDTILGAGVVMPGPFGPVHLSNAERSELEGWDDVDPVAALEAVLGVPVVVENDATAAAIGERVNGVADQLKTYCYIYFGVGLGLGLVSDGLVIRGAFGNAGEIGHVVVRSNRKSGPLETFASRMSLRDHMAEYGVMIESVADLEALHRAQNQHLARWLDQAAAPLSQAIAIAENLFDPEAVILGGAMPDGVLDALIDRMDLTSDSVSNRTDRRTPRVLRGGAGRMTAALGGAALIIHDAFTPRIKARL